jgi:hypothetical protein
MRSMQQMKQVAFWSLIILVCGWSLSCKKKEEVVDFHYNYFPQEKGRFVIYSVHERNVDSAGSASLNYTRDYFIKTVIGDTLVDNSGRIVKRYLRYTSSSANGPWLLKDIWTSYRAGDKAELVEENNRIIKLVFAPSKYKEWNANAYTVLDPLDCYYSNLYKSLSINGIHFDSTVTVEQADELNLIQYKRKFEKYAANVGLIQKHYKDFEINNYDSTSVHKGYELMMDVVQFGIE